MIEVGDVLAGKYSVLAEIGAGGMGHVFRAENMVTGKQVALKCLHAHLTADAAERLLREARAVSNLSHSNVVDVYDVVRDGETLFLVMELLRGETLRAYLVRNPKPSISEFVALILPAMSGVEAAHQCGVIHRDLKPENIFLAQVGGMKQAVVKVLDFGIAKLAAARGATITRTGAALGTPLYMSLEQLRGDKDIDPRADVYAFGVMLYEAVTGRMPYEAETLPELAIKVATTDARPVKMLRADVPTALARVIDWSLLRDRSQRLPNMHTLQQELEAFAHARTFRRQMTDRNAPLPRLAAERADPATVSTAPTEPASVAPAPPDIAVSRREMDTLRANEIAAGLQNANPSWLRSRWVIGGAVAAIGLVAGSLWLKVQAERQPAITASSRPLESSSLTSPERTRSSQPADDPHPAANAPVQAESQARPDRMPALGASIAVSATELGTPITVVMSEPARKESASPSLPLAAGKRPDLKPTAHRERVPAKPSPVPSEEYAAQPRAAVLAAETPKASARTPTVTAPSPVLAGPAERDARDLIGF